MRNKYTYWSSLGKKPKGFTNIKGKPFYYKYNCILTFIEENNTLVDIIEIRVKMDKDRKIDYDETKKLLIEDYGLGNVSFYDGLFKRDGYSFPFIDTIKTYDDKDSYFSFKKLKNRNKKIKKIIKKL